MTKRVALVVGATSGMGAESAVAFAKAGYDVAISGRREDRGQVVAQAIHDAGGNALFVRADASVEADSKALVDATLSRFGRLDVAFNNAGIEGTLHQLTHEQSLDNYRQVFDINVGGVLLGMKYQAPALIESGGGSIINNASVAGLVGFPGMSVYAASKHAVVGLTKTAALEYGQQGVRVNAVAPGPIETEMFDRFADDELRNNLAAMNPSGRVGNADEIASAVLWLADRHNTYTTGQVIAVDGGYVSQ